MRWLALVTLVFAARLAAQVPAEVTGHVTARADGHPIANARVEGAVTDADGAFVLRGLEPGRRTLRVQALGFRAVNIDVDVANGRATVADIALDEVPANLQRMTVVAAGDTAGATTVTREQILQSGRNDLGAVLQDRAGVLVVSTGGPGAPSHLSIRGSSANEVLVLVDGVPINSPMTGEADLSTIPVSQIERVTVIPGAQSARWGGRAMAGVVLIETRRPTIPDAELDASAASFGERDAALSIGSSTGTLSASRRLSRGDFPYDVPAVRGGGTAIRGDDGYSADAIDGALTRDAGPVALRLHATYDANARGLPGSVAAPSFTAHGDDDRLAGGLDATESRGPVRWTADIEADREHTRFNDSTPPFGAPYDDHTTANSLTELVSADVGGPSLSGAVGAESRLIDVTATDLDSLAPTTQHEDGLWARAHARVAIVNVEAGARADWSSLLSGVFVSPTIGVSATRGVLTALVQYGDGFTPPSLADQFFHEGVLVQPNPSLQPERVHGDLEGRLTLRDVVLGPLHLGSEIAAYRSNVDGMILWFPDYRFVWSPRNINVHRYGWDATGTAAVPSLGASIRGTITDVAVEYAGGAIAGQVAYRPRVSAAITTSVTRWRASLDVTNRYVGDRRTVQGSALNSLGAYWLTDAQLTLRVLGPFDLQGGVDNAFDHHVALLFDYPLPARTWRIGFRLHTLSTSSLR